MEKVVRALTDVNGRVGGKELDESFATLWLLTRVWQILRTRGKARAKPLLS